MSSSEQGFTRIRKQSLVFAGLSWLVVVILVALIGDVATDPQTATLERFPGELERLASDLSHSQAMGLVLMGLGAGLLSGCIGMGGGVLKVAGLLLLFSQDIFFARAISLVTMFVSSAISFLALTQDGKRMPRMTRPMLVTAAVAAAAGALFGDHIPAAMLITAFGFFLLFLGLQTLALILADPDEATIKDTFRTTGAKAPRLRLSAFVGALHGFMCGLLGISGGVISTPLQQTLLRTPARVAIVNTLLISVVSTGVAGTIVLWTGFHDGRLDPGTLLSSALCVGGGAFVGALIGARAGKQLNTAVLRLLFVFITVSAGGTILF